MDNNSNLNSKTIKEAFSHLSGGALQDATISEIRIFEENYVLNILVMLKTTKNEIVRIQFEEVIEYYFNYHQSRGFYDVEDYKFIYLEDAKEYYITFDPDQAVEGVSGNDSDLIRSRSFCLV